MINFEQYLTIRELGFPAQQALRYIKTDTKFRELESHNLVRFSVIPDECYDYDNLAGDCYDPKVNSDINPKLLAKREKEFKARIARTGVWGIQSEYFNGEEWLTADAVWGFIGYDWEFSGYDTGVKQSATDAYDAVEVCGCCGRPKLTNLGAHPHA